MQTNPKVSIIIPNYNHALYLKQRIKSVLHQSFQDFELIILDDCSTDYSREIIEQYRSNPKVSHIIYNNKNSGSVFKQWIKGIERAIGEYIWIAESDDFASEFFLEETVTLLQNDSSLGMVFTSTQAINEKNEPFNNIGKEKEYSLKKMASFGNVIDSKNVVLFLVSQMIIENASSVLFRKSELMKVNFEKLKTFQNTGDRFTYIGIALESKIKLIPKPLCFMRLHEHNTTKKNTENGNIHRDRLQVINYYYKHFSNSEYKKEMAFFYKQNYFFFMNYCSYQENLELLNNIKKTKAISAIFYILVKYYMFLFLKKKVNIKGVRGLYYRILLLLN